MALTKVPSRRVDLVAVLEELGADIQSMVTMSHLERVKYIRPFTCNDLAMAYGAVKVLFPERDPS